MTEFVLPETRYALSGDVNVAYQVMGEWTGGRHYGPRVHITY